MKDFESSLSTALGRVQAGKKYLAAVSGGADSTAMLAALAALRKEAGFDLYCAHVDHRIRPAEESRADALAVKALCEKLEVPCRIITIPPGKIAAAAGSGGPGIEGAARFYRLRALHREARRIGADWILTAHTRDDLLENLLMRILRGSGPAGLAAMPRTRGRMLRPLLNLTRQDVLAYLEARGLPYQTDSTNVDIRYFRNRVRLKLIPVLDSFFPSWRSSLPALAETQSLTAEFIASEVRKRLPWEADAGVLRLGEADFLNAPPIVREEAVFAGIDMLAALRRKKTRHKTLHNRAPRRAVIRRAPGQPSREEDLGPVRLRRRNGCIEMLPALHSRWERGFSLVIKKAGTYTLRGKLTGLGKNLILCIRAVNAPAGEIPANGNPACSAPPPTAVHTAFHAQLPLVVRNHRGRDRIWRGGHKRRFSAILDRKACSEYTGIITALDTIGVAAFIGIGRQGDLLVQSREVFKAGVSEGGGSFVVEVRGTEAMNV